MRHRSQPREADAGSRYWNSGSPPHGPPTRAVICWRRFEQLDVAYGGDGLRAMASAAIQTGRSATYWDLLAGRRFNRPITGDARLKKPADYAVVGQSARRLDLLGKVSGAPSYVHDMALPAMLQARVLRPPGYRARLVNFDRASVSALPGIVAVIQEGQFIAMVAEREELAIAALAVASDAAQWDFEGDLPAAEDIYCDLLAKPAQSNLIVDGAAVDDPIPPVERPAEAEHTSGRHSASFSDACLARSSAAVALWRGAS